MLTAQPQTNCVARSILNDINKIVYVFLPELAIPLPPITPC